MSHKTSNTTAATKLAPITTTLPPNLPAEQVALAQAWVERCARGEFSPGVVGVGEIRVFGLAGDAPVAFPRIMSLAALDAIAPEERWAAGYATSVVTAHQGAGRMIFGVNRGQVMDGDPLATFDVTYQRDILVLSPITGG